MRCTWVAALSAGVVVSLAAVLVGVDVAAERDGGEPVVALEAQQLGRHLYVTELQSRYRTLGTEPDYEGLLRITCQADHAAMAEQQARMQVTRPAPEIVEYYSTVAVALTHVETIGDEGRITIEERDRDGNSRSQSYGIVRAVQEWKICSNI
jgi:hypothetical protein